MFHSYPYCETAWDLNQRTLLTKLFLNKKGVQIEEKQQDMQDDVEDVKQVILLSTNDIIIQIRSHIKQPIKQILRGTSSTVIYLQIKQFMLVMKMDRSQFGAYQY